MSARDETPEPDPGAADAGLVPTPERSLAQRAPGLLRRGLSLATEISASIVRVEQPGEVRRFEGHGDFVTSVALSPHGSRAASGSWDHTVGLWDVASGVLLHRCEGHADRVSAVAFAPDGGTVYSAAWDASLRAWDTATGQEIESLVAGEDLKLHSLAVSPAGRLFAGASDGCVYWREPGSAAWDGQIELGAGAVRALASASGGKRLLIGSGDLSLARDVPGRGAVCLWDLESGAAVWRAEGFGEPFLSVAVSPDGQQALGSSARPAPARENSVRLWELESGTELRCLELPLAPVYGVQYCPDGRRAVVGGGDRMVRLVRLETGHEIAALAGHEDRILSVAVAPDGRHALSGSADHTLRLWRLPD
jgi:WD40 repeat protein